MNPPNTTLDIIPSRRRAEYSFDVFLNGLWVASAKTYAGADDVACDLWQATQARIVASVMERLEHPRPCASCGDLTSADLCPACSEDRLIDLPLDLDFMSVGWPA